MSAREPRFDRFAARIKGSRVIRVGVVYAGAAFVVLQLGDLLLPKLPLPRGADILLIVLLALGFPVTLLIAWALGPVGDREAAEGPQAAARAPAKCASGVLDSLAVLPFVDMSTRRDQEYLSEGITEELLAALGSVSGLRVPARTSSFAFKGKDLDVREIAAKLGVDAVLEGSVRTDGERLRITVQLVEAATGFRLWSQNFDRQMSSVFEVQDEISREILNRLRVHLPGGDAQPLVAVQTENPEAYRHYLRGRYFWNKGSQECLDLALRELQQALDLDPAYARAYAATADVLLSMGQQTYLDPHEAFPRARAAARRALDIDPQLAEAHAAEGLVALAYEWDLPTAGRELRRAVELAGGSPIVHLHYVRYLLAAGRNDEAEAQAKAALERDPLSIAACNALGLVYRSARRYPDAIEQYRRSLTLDPVQFPAHYQLAFNYAYAGRCAEAIEAAERAVDIGQRSLFALGALGFVYAACGRPDEARGVLTEMTSRGREAYLCPNDVAVIHAGLGEVDQALDWLDRSYAERDHATLFVDIEPAFDPVHDHPRFQALRAKIGLPRPRPAVSADSA
jgi:adenylate cyclase